MAAAGACPLSGNLTFEPFDPAEFLRRAPEVPPRPIARPRLLSESDRQALDRAGAKRRRQFERRSRR